jgi:hypothetical protein
MHVKPRELFHTIHETRDPPEDSTLLLVIALTLLGMIGYFFVQYAIPVISRVICDFLNHSIEATGGLLP